MRRLFRHACTCAYIMLLTSPPVVITHQPSPSSCHNCFNSNYKDFTCIHVCVHSHELDNCNLYYACSTAYSD